MSTDVRGGSEYALLRRHYDNDDYVAFPFTATQDFYLVGAMAYLNDITVATAHPGWTLFTHGQPFNPISYWALLGYTAITLPAVIPAFEAKDLLFHADVDCFIRFEVSARVQHLIPANTYMRFHRRCLMFFVQTVLVPAGTLRCWLEG